MVKRISSFFHFPHKRTLNIEHSENQVIHHFTFGIVFDGMKIVSGWNSLRKKNGMEKDKTLSTRIEHARYLVEDVTRHRSIRYLVYSIARRKLGREISRREVINRRLSFVIEGFEFEEFRSIERARVIFWDRARENL